MILVLVTAAIVLVVIALVGFAVDRSARAAAWRHIALERRWNQEQQQR